ncbi:citrate lyase subunit beta [Rhodococcus sp. SC4]|nr:citrate lyase subunit beta [Rhodococcus sp. SC4]RZI91956.1 MAG: CoA ester lyase [Microbacterium sp.]
MPTSTHPRHRVDHTIARSWLLTGASDPATIHTADAGSADVVILDLEDGSPDKHLARTHVQNWLAGGGHAWVRINDATTSDWAHDLDMLSDSAPVAGIVLAKTEDPEQVSATAARLRHPVPIVAMIETALGLEEARAIARVPETVRIAFGRADFRKDTGAAGDPLSLAYARSRIVVASRAERISAPIDGATPTDDLDELRAGITIGTNAGMTGKLCLDPSHTDVVNNALSPSAQELAWADTIITTLGKDGEHVTNGDERPQLERALHIHNRARAFTL